MTKLAALAQNLNVEPTALATIVDKGFQFWVHKQAPQVYFAERDGWDFVANDACELLGLITIFDAIQPKEYHPRWCADGCAEDGAAQASLKATPVPFTPIYCDETEAEYPLSPDVFYEAADDQGGRPAEELFENECELYVRELREHGRQETALAALEDAQRCAIRLLKRRGYQVWFERVLGFCAEKSRWDFCADTPCSLLGLIAIYENVGPEQFQPYWWRHARSEQFISFESLPTQPARMYESIADRR